MDGLRSIADSTQKNFIKYTNVDNIQLSFL